MVQAAQRESADLFSELVNRVNVTGAQVGGLLGAHQTALGSQVEGRIQRLEQEVAQLRSRSVDLSRLADMQDHICFLKVISAGGRGGSSCRLISCAFHWINK